MNNENLKPQNKRTKAEQREIARKGGIASGVARRERKSLRERLLLMGDEIIKNSKGEELPREDVIALQVARKAAGGDLKAARLYAELTGQLTQQIAVDTAPPIVILPHQKH